MIFIEYLSEDSLFFVTEGKPYLYPSSQQRSYPSSQVDLTRAFLRCKILRIYQYFLSLFVAQSETKLTQFSELEQYSKKTHGGGFLPAVKQLANVASLPGIVKVDGGRASFDIFGVVASWWCVDG